jgi:hypothetical protein
LERQSERQRWILHRFKFNRYNQVTEAMFGRTIRGRDAALTLHNNTMLVTAAATDGTDARSSDTNSGVQTTYWTFADHRQIGKLKKMKKLHLSHFDAVHAMQVLNCVSADVSGLECVILDQCQFIYRDTENQTDRNPSTTVKVFPKLTKLMINKPFGFRLQDPVDVEDMRKFMTFVIKTMPHLQELHFSFVPYITNLSLDGLLNVLCDVMVDHATGSLKATNDNIHQLSLSSSSSSSSFCSNLKVLTWNHSGMTDTGFKRLLVEVFPLYKNLQNISLQNNNISSLLGLVDIDCDNENIYNGNCKDDQPRPFSLSVRSMNLQHNNIMTKLHRGNKFRSEVMAIKYLLRHRLPFCGSLSSPWEDWESLIEHELRVNRSGGRVLLRPTTRQEGEGDESVTLLTPSLFPLILHRSYSHSSSGQGFLPGGFRHSTPSAVHNHPHHATAMAFLVRSFLPDLLTTTTTRRGRTQHQAKTKNNERQIE